MSSPKIADMKENIDHARIRCAMYSVLELIVFSVSVLSVSNNGNDFLKRVEWVEKRRKK